MCNGSCLQTKIYFHSHCTLTCKATAQCYFAQEHSSLWHGKGECFWMLTFSATSFFHAILISHPCMCVWLVVPFRQDGNSKLEGEGGKSFIDVKPVVFLLHDFFIKINVCFNTVATTYVQPFYCSGKVAL